MCICSEAKKAPSMYYILSTHNRRCDRNIIILMLLTTETSHLNGTAAYDESKAKVRYYQQNIKLSKEFARLYFFAIRSDVSYIWQFQDLILGIHDQGQRQGQWPRSYMNQINQFIHIAFVSCKSGPAFLRHKQFIIWPWYFEVKVTAELKKLYQLIYWPF